MTKSEKPDRRSVVCNNTCGAFTHYEITEDHRPTGLLCRISGRMRPTESAPQGDLVWIADRNEIVDARLLIDQLNGPCFDMESTLRERVLAKAREQYAAGSDDDIEVDDDAVISHDTGEINNPGLGWWVRACVFVYADEVLIDDEPEGDMSTAAQRLQIESERLQAAAAEAQRTAAVIARIPDFVAESIKQIHADRAAIRERQYKITLSSDAANGLYIQHHLVVQQFKEEGFQVQLEYRHHPERVDNELGQICDDYSTYHLTLRW